MTSEYWVYDKDKEYLETVHMTEEEFDRYFKNNKAAKYYRRHEAGANWQY